MNRHLAGYCRQQRLRQGITLHALARTVAPDNARKTAGRIGRFESEGVIGEELLAAVADALRIELPVVEELLEKDHQESFIRGDLAHLAEHRTWTTKPANPTRPPTKSPV